MYRKFGEKQTFGLTVSFHMLTENMKLPFIFSASGGGNGYHETSFDQDDFDTENQDEIGNDNVDANFEEYLWMENEEEFDKSELQRLEEEALMKECMENMQDDAYDNDEMANSEGGHWQTHE